MSRKENNIRDDRDEMRAFLSISKNNKTCETQKYAKVRDYEKRVYGDNHLSEITFGKNDS